MAKDKKPKKEKKSGKQSDAKSAKTKQGKSSAKAGTKLKAIATNPIVADVVAAALVATASALKDPQRARALASEAADELGKLSKAGSERGNALWEMALQIGKRSLESFSGQSKAGKAEPKATKSAATKGGSTKRSKGSGARSAE